MTHLTHTLLTLQVDTVDTLDNVIVAGKWGVCSVNCPGAVSSAGSGSGSGICETVGGPDPGRPCVFPAIFNGVSYTECMQQKCATEVSLLRRMMGLNLPPLTQG